MRHKIDRVASLKENRFIRAHKTIIIGLVTALLIIAFAVKSSDSVGSCQKQASIRIIDEAGGRTLPARSINTSENSPFKNYVTNISKYFFFKIDEVGHCKGNLDSDPQVELIFVYRPLKSYGIAPFNFDLKESNDTKYLDSPWVKLTATKSPKLVVRAAFIWNERQFLFDQAVLSGARASSTAPLLPINSSIYWKFLGDYSGKHEATLSASKEVKATVLADLAKRLPVDMMWLFLHSGNWDGHIVAEMAMDKIIEHLVERYIDLTKALLNCRFESIQTEQRYSSILDLKHLFDLDQYRIGEFRYH